MPIEIDSPLSRSTRSIPDRLPLCVARAGRADSLNSLIASFRSDFLNFDLITPACISHLRERGIWPATAEVRTAVPERNQAHSASQLLAREAGNVGILRPALRSESRHTRRVGNH